MAENPHRCIGAGNKLRWGRPMDIQDSDAAYYRMREEQELGRARDAAREEVRSIHLTLAEKYRSLAIKAERPMPGSIEDVTLDGSLASKFI
jgi:hypothetical protein